MPQVTLKSDCNRLSLSTARNDCLLAERKGKSLPNDDRIHEIAQKIVEETSKTLQNKFDEALKKQQDSFQKDQKSAQQLNEKLSKRLDETAQKLNSAEEANRSLKNDMGNLEKELKIVKGAVEPAALQKIIQSLLPKDTGVTIEAAHAIVAYSATFALNAICQEFRSDCTIEANSLQSDGDLINKLLPAPSKNGE